MSYCTQAQIQARISLAGVEYVADDDGDGVAGTTEKTNSLGTAITAADVEIDEALTPHGFSLPLSASDSWLTVQAINLAAEHACERSGGGVPASLAAAAQRSRDKLNQVRLGEIRVPGLTYPLDGYQEERRRLGVPRAANPSCRRGRRR